jgi:hypothetical protein
MPKRTVYLKIVVVFSIALAVFTSATAVQASAPDPIGSWLADWEILDSEGGYYTGITGMARFEIAAANGGYLATVYFPALGINGAEWPVYLVGDTIYIGFLVGTITGDSIQGEHEIDVDPYGLLTISWQAMKLEAETVSIDPGPGPACENLPQPLCTGSAEYCSELVQFDPASTLGYDDYPANGETWENQYRSYLRRDLMQLISYATIKLQCKTVEWDFGNSYPLGLLDMSEADGSIPGSSIGYPGHPPGTHTNGRDIDVAYYQFHMPDNWGRPVCDSFIGYPPDANHCLSQPYLLDPWRTALFSTFLAEHPLLRVFGVDGKIGPVLEDSLDWFAANGWVDSDLRAALPMAYEETDQGWGWYYFHHHHMHISMNRLAPILSSLEIVPETLNLKNAGKYLTVYIELDECYDPGQIDIQTVMITVDGYSTFTADPEKMAVGDYNENGIPDLMVKFDRQAVQSLLSFGQTEITLYGSVNGIYFQGADSILVK